MSETETHHFTHRDLECKIVKQRIGHWCGYVKRPEEIEPMRWRSLIDHDEDEIRDPAVDVFGGVTYGPDDDGWVGFDAAHAASVIEYTGEDSEKKAVKEETKNLASQIARLASDN